MKQDALMNSRLLIIDDDEQLNKRLKRYLQQFNFDVQTVSTPSRGLAIIEKDPPDLITLDVMMPEMDGFETIREIRKTHDIPVIMLTARGDVTDRIVGLELGADDYLPKPFEARELVARIQTVLKRSASRSKSSAPSVFKLDGLEVNFNNHEVKLGNESIVMTHMEFEVFSIFIQNRGIILSRDFLLDKIRGLEWEIYNRSIDVLISRLRQKLKEDSKNPHFIKTIRGSGYIFIKED